MKKLLLSLFAATFLATAAYAVQQGTRTPLVAPNETGEDSLHQGEVFNVARIKPGSCTATATGSGAAGGSETATCNGAAGAVTTVSLTIATVGALNTVTITDSKVQAGDMCQATVDATGAAATSAVFAQTCEVSANTLTVILTNILAVSPAAAVKVYFFVQTQGNPN